MSLAEENPLQDLLGELRKNRLQILEDFAKAYLADTGLSPKDVVLVQNTSDPSRCVWYFEAKNKLS
jgi:hypothetical protein